MTRHFFLDLDKTLTASRSLMLPEHQAVFERLCNGSDVVVVSGGNLQQVREQITSRFEGKYYVLAQSGNHALDVNGSELWREELDGPQSEAVLRFIEKLKSHFAGPHEDSGDYVEHRGAQISYSVTGFHADMEVKYAFDPDYKKRAAALASFPDDIGALKAAGIEVTPAGTTSFNFLLAGKHKGFNIARLAEMKGWDTKECIYVGDALFSGGNDGSVIGVIPTQPAKDPEETFAYLRSVVG